MQDLKGSSLKLWLYFNKNQDGYQFELSPKACHAWGIKKDSYYSGVEELIRKGYLIPIYEGSNIYQFHEVAQAEKAKAQKATIFSEFDNRLSENQKKTTVFPERNNTNITEIKQNKTMAHSDSQIGVDKSAFAGGESGGCGFATTAINDCDISFPDMSPQQQKEYLKSLGF